MLRVYRYEIPIREIEREGPFAVELPLGATILHVAVQERAPHAPCLWCLVDPDRPLVTRHLALVGTGWDMSSIAVSDHVGTFQQFGYVWHIFECIPPAATGEEPVMTERAAATAEPEPHARAEATEKPTKDERAVVPETPVGVERAANRETPVGPERSGKDETTEVRERDADGETPESTDRKWRVAGDES